MLTENRKGLVVDVELTQADGYAERDSALGMLERSACGSATLGADRGYDTCDFVWDLCSLGITPHVAQHDRGRRSAIDRRHDPTPGLSPHPAAAQAGRMGLRLVKTVGAGSKLRYLGRARNKLWFELTAAYNLTRLPKLETAAA